MAKTNNKYTSINFNHIYDKSSSSSSTTSTASPATKPLSSTAASYSSTASTLYKSHLQNNGRMLVLTRPTPKPVTLPTKPTPQPPQTQPTSTTTTTQAHGSGSEPTSDPISLRPLGRTGAGPCLTSPVQEVLSSAVSVKTGKFVPPHLRPGFIAKEEKPGPDVNRGGPVHRNHHHHQQQQQQQHGGSGYYYGSRGRYGENGRPRSGGYDRVRRGVGESDLGRPRSSGYRPSSSG